MTITPSLFDAPTDHPIAAGSDWMSQLIGGTATTTICVLAVAFLGFMMMSGRSAIRDGIRIVIGCFVLLGAPTIAFSLLHLADGAQQQPILEPTVAGPPPPTPKLPPANYDPYAGASLRIE